jgi:hypothetical protein
MYSPSILCVYVLKKFPALSTLVKTDWKFLPLKYTKGADNIKKNINAIKTFLNIFSYF